MRQRLPRPNGRTGPPSLPIVHFLLARNHSRVWAWQSLMSMLLSMPRNAFSRDRATAEFLAHP